MMVRPSQMGLVVFHQHLLVSMDGAPRETDMTCLDHLIIAVDICCILLWVVYPAHSCPKIYAWNSMAHELRCTVGSNLFASRDGLDGLLRYQACVDHFSNRKPFHINVRLHNCLMLILFSQESLPGYSWGGCGKSYAFTRFTTTAILPGNLETHQLVTCYTF